MFKQIAITMLFNYRPYLL